MQYEELKCKTVNAANEMEDAIDEVSEREKEARIITHLSFHI